MNGLVAASALCYRTLEFSELSIFPHSLRDVCKGRLLNLLFIVNSILL